jgi:ubiquinone/menaquinone biosynthesis C-methylase UbiE
MSRPQFTEHRKRLLRDVSGEILEIGVGTGLNLEHYPKGVRRVTTVDPSVGMSRLLRQRTERCEIYVDHCVLGAEQLSFPDSTFDCVVSTWTLCSIADVARAVAELHRVLRPGGRFLFLEHGLSDTPSVQAWQRRLNGLQKLIGGCRLDLNVQELFEHQPFESIAIDRFCLERAPRTHGTMYQGVATK